MKIAGLEKNSFIDYPQKIAAVIFTPGCNLDCYYCHNRRLLLTKREDLLSEREILDFLQKRIKHLDGVVISGGEPTLQEGLSVFIREVKDIGYSIKLDTNGTNPRLLEQLLGQNLLDYVAMDVKAPLRKYRDICGNALFLEGIEDSIRLLLTTKQAEYEFRTTFIPQLSQDDIMEIADMIEGADLYALQQYRIPEVPEGHADPRVFIPPHEPGYLWETADRVAPRVKKCIIRGI